MAALHFSRRLPRMVTGDGAARSGALSSASFDTDLTAQFGAAEPHEVTANYAVLFTATSGTLNTCLLLVADANGTVGYQSGAEAGRRARRLEV